MFDSVLEICGAISIIGGAAVMVWKFLKPQIKRGQDIEKNKEAIARLQRHEQNDFIALEKIIHIEREQCRVMIVILNHLIDGNNVDKMKGTRDQLQKLMSEIEK